MLGENEAHEVELAIQCRNGPIGQRRCTDWGCCIVYLGLFAFIIFLAFFAAGGARMTFDEVEQKLSDVNRYDLILSIPASRSEIYVSVTITTGICLVITILTFLLPSIMIYLIIPVILIMLLLIGVAFLLRFFGNDLPFFDLQTQDAYAAQGSFVSLSVGAGFILAFIVCLIILMVKWQRLKFVTACLALSKAVFWDNPYLILLSIILCGVTLLLLYLNIRILMISQLQKDGQNVINADLFSIIVLVEMAWTHGYIQALSNFLFEAITVYWYYAEKNFGDNYSRVSKCLLPSLGLTCRHMGTIVYGSVIAWIPQFLNIIGNRCEESSEACYSVFCCFHKCFCEHISKYQYVSTVMYSYSFDRAGHSMKDIRATAKHTFPELYMVGNFFVTFMKVFSTLTNLIICYFLMSHEGSRYTQVIHMVVPLIIVGLISNEMAEHLLNPTGLVGDTVYLTYTIDYNCQSSNFGQLSAEHCPKDAYEIIRDARVGKYASYD